MLAEGREIAQEAAPDRLLIVAPDLGSQARAIATIATAAARDSALEIAPSDGPQAPGPRTAGTGLVFYTSGSTGAPKPNQRSWEELFDNVSSRGSGEDRFLLTYSVARFAGLQVLFHCMRHGSTLVLPRLLTGSDALLSAGEAHEVTHLSLTPSLLRRLLMVGAADRLRAVRQITLGGEYASQATLDSAASAWPHARITSIYASSEAGACFAVSDGTEGIPLDMLGCGRNGRAADLAEDGELIVTLPDGRAIATGDYFRIEGNRLRFEGRREDLLNVGGFKVSPAKVESVLMSVPGVTGCRVFGRRNPVTGQVVAAEVTGDFEEDALRQACEAALERQERPRSIRRVAELELELEASGKLRRPRAAR